MKVGADGRSAGRGWGVEEEPEQEERSHHSTPNVSTARLLPMELRRTRRRAHQRRGPGFSPRPVVGCGRTGAIALREMYRKPMPTVMLAEWAAWQERPSACLARASTAQHRFLNKAPSPGRFDADADACGGQQAKQEQPLACVVLVLHPETGTKPRFFAFTESPPVLNQ